MEKFVVIEDITDGYETTAKAGEILTVDRFEGYPCLFKGDLAVCDVDSHYGREHCKQLT